MLAVPPYYGCLAGPRRELEAMKNTANEREQREKESMALQQAATAGLGLEAAVSKARLGLGTQAGKEPGNMEFGPGDIVDALCTPIGAAAGAKEFIRGEVRR